MTSCGNSTIEMTPRDGSVCAPRNVEAEERRVGNRDPGVLRRVSLHRGVELVEPHEIREKIIVGARGTRRLAFGVVSG